MNNLFKRSVASLALVGAMTGSLFGGNAAYIDIRVNYLSGTGKATLGYESWNSDRSTFKAGAKKDLVELYIRVLDKDGEFADKGQNGKNLESMSVTRGGNSIANFGTSDGTTGSTGSNVIQRGKIATPEDNGKAIADKNAARYTLDYSLQNVKSLLDTVNIKAGNLNKAININLVARDARGLIVRATKKGKMSATGGTLNALFTNIDIEGDNNLSAQSSGVSQITAGEKVPLKIYATTASSDYADGRFTSSDDLLNGKTIVVVAVGDYDFDDTTGNTTTYLSQTEFTMNNGVASGEMVINYGLPDKNSSASSATNGATGHNTSFSSISIGGLGVAFIAYVKDDSTISNKGVIALSGGVLRTDKTNFVIEGNNTDTDVLKVKSGSIVGFKAGILSDDTPAMAEDYFSDRSNVFIANNRGLVESVAKDRQEIVKIVAVDKLGNPGTISKFILAGSSHIDRNPSKIKIGTETIPTGVNATAGSFAIASGDINISNAETNMTTDMATGITTADLNVSDGVNRAATRKVVQVYYAGPFSSIPPAVFTVTTLDVMGETPKDIKGDLRSAINLNITNAKETLKTEHTKEGDYADTKLYINVLRVGGDDTYDDNVSLSFKVLNEDGEANKAFEFNNSNVINDEFKTNSGSIIEINATATTTISINGGTSGIGTIVLDNTSKYKYVVGSKTVVTLKGSGNAENNRSHRQYVDASVKTTISTKGAEDFVDSTTEKGIPGQVVIDFDFSGDFITQNVGNTRAKIVFGDTNNSSSANASIKVGVVGKPFSSASTLNGNANSDTISALIPANGRLSVALYGIQAEKQTGKKEKIGVNDPGTGLAANSLYYIRSIQVNGFNVLATSRDDNELTKAIEVDVNFVDRNITIAMAAGTNKVAKKVNIVKLGNANNGEGDSNDKAIALPQGVISSGNFGASAITTESSVKVLTNVYYTLFSDNADLIVQDAYGNPINMESATVGDNYTLTTSDAACSIVKMNSGDDGEPATIFFKDCAAGKEVVVTVTAKGSLEENKAFNTITFTNIVKSSENTKFMVSLNVGSETYNVANNDVVVKIVGDGNTAVKDAKIVVTSENKDAEIILRPVPLLNGAEFTSLVANGELTTNIATSGDYFVIRSDKKGKVTVKVDATIPKAEAKSKKDTSITGSVSFNVTLVDLVAPTATVKATASGITATITDLSLDETATTVEVYKDGTKFKSLTGSAGTYTAKVPQGLYSVRVNAVDTGGNTLKKDYPILVGKAGTSATLETTLISTGSYDIAGTFSSYDFADKDAAFDWVYTDNEGVSYQLLGKTATAAEPFGWKETDVKTTSKDWYMIKLTGDDEGPFGWVLINKDTNAAFKLQGAKADHTFEFSGALYLKATVSESSVKFTKK